MRTMKYAAFCMALALPALLWAESDTPALDWRDLYEKCGEFPQAEMRRCLAEKAKKSQQALRQAEKNMADALPRWDEDNRYINEAKEKLSASNKAFASYRDAECTFDASLTGGGLNRDTAYQVCVAVLNNKRAAQLRDTLSILPLK